MTAREAAAWLADEVARLETRSLIGGETARALMDAAMAMRDAHAAEAVAAERTACADLAKSSTFVDGPKGTIEGQIAAAIRARGAAR